MHFEVQPCLFFPHQPGHSGVVVVVAVVVVVVVAVVVVVVAVAVVGVVVVVVVVGVVVPTCVEKRQLWVGRSKQTNGQSQSHGNNGS